MISEKPIASADNAVPIGVAGALSRRYLLWHSLGCSEVQSENRLLNLVCPVISSHMEKANGRSYERLQEHTLKPEFVSSSWPP